MTKLIIVSHTNDFHSAAVALAMRDRGHCVDVIHGADFPQQQAMTHRVSPSGSRLVISRPNRPNVTLDDADVFWNRRQITHMLPEGVHEHDHRFVDRECRYFATGTWLGAARNAFWINPDNACAGARRKPYQLVTASELGVPIPDTLMSNDPNEIRSFCGSYPSVVYKPFLPAGWATRDGGYAALFTVTVRPEDLPDDATLSKCPGIFQERVEKAYELRVTAMGRSLFAVKLHSQQLDWGRTDWRRAQGLGLVKEHVEVSDDVRAICEALMDRLNLVFGCFDFIVTPDGQAVFLEVNEMGQWLWIEQAIPELTLLDAFCDFCESRDPRFVYNTKVNPIRLQPYEDAVRLFLEAEAAAHRSPGAWHVAAES